MVVVKWVLLLLLLVQADAYCIKKGNKCPKNHDAVTVLNQLGALVDGLDNSKSGCSTKSKCKKCGIWCTTTQCELYKTGGF